MDPLSIATGVAGVVSFAAHTLLSVKTFMDTASNAPQLLTETHSEASVLQMTLSFLEKFLRTNSNQLQAGTGIWRQNLEICFESCKSIFADLGAEMAASVPAIETKESISKKTAMKIAWDEDKILNIRSRLRAISIGVQSIMSCLQLSLMQPPEQARTLLRHGSQKLASIQESMRKIPAVKMHEAPSTVISSTESELNRDLPRIALEDAPLRSPAWTNPAQDDRDQEFIARHVNQTWRGRSREDGEASAQSNDVETAKDEPKTTIQFLRETRNAILAVLSQVTMRPRDAAAEANFLGPLPFELSDGYELDAPFETPEAYETLLALKRNVVVGIGWYMACSCMSHTFWSMDARDFCSLERERRACYACRPTTKSSQACKEYALALLMLVVATLALVESSGSNFTIEAANQHWKAHKEDRASKEHRHRGKKHAKKA